MALAFHDRRWGDAEAAFRRALELDPNYATGHHWYAFFLTTLGRFDEALVERRRALEIDPLTPMLGVGLAGLYLAMRQPDRAADAVERTLQRYPRFWYARLDRGQALEQLGRHHEALQDFIDAERTAPDTFMVVASVVGALAATGDAREARRRVAEAERLARSTFVPAFDLGVMRVALGDIDLAFDWLQRSCDMKEAPPHGDRLPPRASTRSVRTRASPSSWRASGCRSTRRAPADHLSAARRSPGS